MPRLGAARYRRRRVHGRCLPAPANARRARRGTAVEKRMGARLHVAGVRAARHADERALSRYDGWRSLHRWEASRPGHTARDHEARTTQVGATAERAVASDETQQEPLHGTA